MDNNIETKESGYVIKVTGIQRSGEIYKKGFYGDYFYSSPLEATLYEDEVDVIKNIEYLREEYNDGTVIFDLCKITREIKIQTEKVEM